MAKKVIEKRDNAENFKDRSLYCFSRSNPIRRFCLFITNNVIFTYTVLVVIIVSSVFLAIENPLDSLTSKKTVVLNILN